jgi:hypothetical protein
MAPKAAGSSPIYKSPQPAPILRQLDSLYTPSPAKIHSDPILFHVPNFRSILRFLGRARESVHFWGACK